MDLTDLTLDDPLLATADGSQHNPTHEEKMDAFQALKYIDEHWYKEIGGKKARWMDLIGDYAGNERFILDGESLLQHVLDDPLLALARTDDPSFQILHAIHSMERLLDEMIRRSAVFDVVFWEDTRYLTLKGGTDFVVSSRSLARALLFSHLVEHSSKMGLEIYAFSGLTDPAWHAYQQRTKPMFVMLNDGGMPENTDYDMATRILIQRHFIFSLLTSGIAVTLLHGAEFRDSRIFSFVLEESFGLNTRESFPTAFWNAVQDGAAKLGNKLGNRISQTSLQVARLNVASPASSGLDHFLKDVLDHLVLRHAEDLPLFWELTSLYFLHIMILPTLPVPDRARQSEDFNGDLVATLVGTFLPKINPIMATFVSKANRFVDIDGRIFATVLRYTIPNGCPRTSVLTELAGPEISTRLEAVWRSVNAPPPDFMKISASFPNDDDPEASSAVSNEELASFSLLPFQHEVFDDELAAVRVTVSDQVQASPSTVLRFSQDTPFSDTRHGHAHQPSILPKHLGGEGEKNVDERLRRKQLRKDQRLMTHMQRLAATLTGASGRILQQILLLPTGRKVSEITDDSPVSKPQRGKKKVETTAFLNQKKKSKPVTLSGKERIRQEHAREKKAKEDASSKEWWLEQHRQVERMATYEAKMSHLRSLLRNPRTDAGWLSVEIRLYSLHLTIQHWIAEPEPENPKIHDNYVISILRVVKELYTNDSLTGTTLGVLASTLVSLGFTNYIVPLEEEVCRRLQPDRDLEFTFVKLLKSKSHKPLYKFMAIKEDPVIWQLRVFGEYMDRSMDSASDPRVAFQPDAWQREVLDCLDNPKSSILVVAPTSAGKTFISFYAMEKVLRESDDGILVYVAPTKALVNQVAAEVYARFRKDVDGRTCWSIYTRDIRIHDPQRCQILVTVPEMLAIMLLSPPLARTWTSRIRRIILDEIHTIGQFEGGSPWEQILLLAPCPIIGLSATIGDPEKFNSWLESIQREKGFDHKFIHYPHRYSHLRKFAFFPQLLLEDEPFLGLDGDHRPTEMMRFIHPVSTLSFTGVMPPDLSLEAPDLLRLYRVLTANNIGDVARLDPTTFFSRDMFIGQRDVLRYEADIKNTLSRLIAEPDALGQSSPLQRVVREVQDPIIKQTPKAQLNTQPGHSVFFSGLIHLLSAIQATDGLPALLFNFDPIACEAMASHLLEVLEKAEQVWREQSPEWKRKVSQWEAWQVRQKNEERMAQKAAARKRDPDDEAPQHSKDHTWESYFDPQDPSPQFSFASHSAYPKRSLLEDIEDMKWATPSVFLRALWRGIGVHHSGMNKLYRVLVERLYRVGFLRVIIATGTLALGINAPTKSSVFCGDSPFLTALMFRQCAGRAGRRGFDLLGRVVFYGITLDRINRILLSTLPRLTGTFPLSSTMVLRLFSLLEGSGHHPYAIHAINSILRLPHICFGSDVGKSQLLHHLRFSIDYLRRAHLLTREGKPVNLFGIASHLYHTEPSNLAITILLHNGVIHDICSQASSIKAERDLMALLCHLFGRRYLPQVYATTSNIRDLTRKGPSRVVLEPLYPKARAVLRAHQKEIIDIFSAYALVFSSQHADELGPDNRLPLSGDVIGPSDKSIRRPQTALFAHLAETAMKPKARSLFVATSGHGDRIGDVGELVRTVRYGVHLNEHAIPSIEHILDPELPLNAYLYDFFVHGQVNALVNMNGILRGDVWYVLEAFYLVLMSIRGELWNQFLRASKGQEVVSHEAELDDDPENGSENGDLGVDQPESEDTWGAANQSAFERPRSVSDSDWRVYEVVKSVTDQFGEKFKAMWA